MSDNELQGGGFYKQNEQNIVNQLMGNNSQPLQNPFQNEDLAQLRNSVRYIPHDNLNIFAQFMHQQANEGNTQPSQMLRSAIQISQQQEQDQLAKNNNQLENILMKKMDFSKSNHPTACFFHLIFKALAICSHLVLGLFMNTLNVHYLVIIFCAMDFWVVKNITGRLLIGLRWWSECQEDNSTRWVFECKINKGDVNDFNFNVFWSLQIISSLIWVSLLVVNAIGFDISDVIIFSSPSFKIYFKQFNIVCCLLLCFVLNILEYLLLLQVQYLQIICYLYFKIYHSFLDNKEQKEGLKKLASELKSDIPLNFMHGSVRFPL